MGAVLLAVFCGISFFLPIFLGLWYGMLVVSSLRELVFGGCWVCSYLGMSWWIIFFFSSFFFLGAGLWQDKTKGPKKSIKRERFLIHFFPSSLHHILLANEFGFLVFAERGSSSFHQG